MSVPVRIAPALLVAFCIATAPLGATVFTVTKTADTSDGACDSDCSLREAVTEANRNRDTDVIVLPAGIYTLTRTGANEDGNLTGDLDILHPVILVGAGAGSTVIDGNGTDRLLDVQDSFEIFGVTLRNGLAETNGGALRARDTNFGYRVLLQRCVVSGNHALGDGGGIAGDSGTVVLAASTVMDNQADNDGGGLTASSFTVLSSTISGNRAGHFGGGIHSALPAAISIQGSTVVLNQAAEEGGGVYIDPSGPPALVDPFLGGSILAANTAPVYPDCFTVRSQGGNVVGIAPATECPLVPSDARGTLTVPLDPKLGPLSSSLGPTPVYPLLPGSPALGFVAAAALCGKDDQRGQARHAAACDAGAVEHADQASCVPGGAALCLQSGRFRVTAAWSAQGKNGDAQPVPLSEDSGDFWFFAPDNLELTVKVLDGCPVNGHWWVFASGLTDVGVDLRVEDLANGAVWTSSHAAGTTYPPRLDTSALGGCGLSGAFLAPAGGVFGISAAVHVATRQDDTFDGVCDHDCSLRDAVAVSNAQAGPDVIVLAPQVYTLSRAGRGEGAALTGDLDVTSPLLVLGAGADRTVIDGGGIDRVFHAFVQSPLEIHGVTVRHGDARVVTGRDRGDGGAIDADELTLVACHITGNRADNGGGGISAATATLRDSTLSGNEAGVYGGGLANVDTLRLANVTVSGNHAGDVGGGLVLVPYDMVLEQATITGNSASEGGGLWVSFLTCPSASFGCFIGFTLTRSLIAGNTAAHHPDCLGAGGSYILYGIDSGGCSLGTGDRAGTPAAPLDPRLTPLGDNGGTTPTHALLDGSPAVDFLPASLCSGVDQRGRPRPADGNGDGIASCDAGAVERQPGCQPGPGSLCLGTGDRFKVTATWAAQGKTGTAMSHPLALDTGAFWFFDPGNLEMTLKVLNGCAVNQHYWVFLAGLTNVGVDVTVEDTQTGKTWHHQHAGGPPLPTVTDTVALDVCP